MHWRALLLSPELAIGRGKIRIDHAIVIDQLVLLREGQSLLAIKDRKVETFLGELNSAIATLKQST
jgi:hypothetical protein